MEKELNEAKLRREAWIKEKEEEAKEDQLKALAVEKKNFVENQRVLELQE